MMNFVTEKYVQDWRNFTSIDQIKREEYRAEQSSGTSFKPSEHRYSKLIIIINNDTANPDYTQVPLQDQVFIDELNAGDAKIYLNKKLKIDIAPWENGFLAKNKELDIVEFGSTWHEAINGIMENIIYIIDDIVKEDANNLAPHAKKLKKILNSYIKH